MQKTIVLHGRPVAYHLSKRRGQRYMKLSYNPYKGLSISAPRWYPLFVIERFLQDKTDWILDNIRRFPLALSEEKNRQNERAYRMRKEEARCVLQTIAEKYAVQYGISFQKLAVRNQRTRWGSCSRKKNLSFQYKVAFLPDHLRDYIVVHELCHLIEMNHSRRFWDAVSKTIPDYKNRRQELRQHKIRYYIVP